MIEPHENQALKEAFARTKNDIFTLGNEIYSFKTDLIDIKNTLYALNESINSIKIELIELKNQSFIPISKSNFPAHLPTEEPKIPAYPSTPADNPTVPHEIGGLKTQNLPISSGNRGVPTDKQTDQQTDNFEDISSYLPVLKTPVISVDKSQKTPEISHKMPEISPNSPEKPLNQQIQDAEDMLDSLDALKKEIRLKFKQITNQEMLVFSTIYALEESFPEGVEYKQVAGRLKLTESSIRDYVQKLISKGVPVDKIRLNNKKILLKISPKLKNIAPLDTLIRLREL